MIKLTIDKYKIMIHLKIMFLFESQNSKIYPSIY